MNIETNRQKMLMDQIRSLAFAVNDLALYLDTHPCDSKALSSQQEYAKKLHDLRQLYQREYGPLTIYFPQNSWHWIESPWPWDKGGV